MESVYAQAALPDLAHRLLRYTSLSYHWSGDETLSREEAQRKGQMPKAAAPA